MWVEEANLRDWPVAVKPSPVGSHKPFSPNGLSAKFGGQPTTAPLGDSCPKLRSGGGLVKVASKPAGAVENLSETWKYLASGSRFEKAGRPVGFR